LLEQLQRSGIALDCTRNVPGGQRRIAPRKVEAFLIKALSLASVASDSPVDAGSTAWKGRPRT
jgi:hypothetical protein